MQQLFKSFYMAGFECADHINRSGERINLLAETSHDIRVKEDYALLKPIGIHTVREGICWSKVEEKPFKYDFSEVKGRITAAEEAGIQQIWDICHFGFPDDLSPTHPKFIERFVGVCLAFVELYNTCSTQPLFIVPVNEISFLSWHAGEVRGTVPFAINCGFDIKYHLCKAAISGTKAIKQLCPSAIIILSEPLIKIHPAFGQPSTDEIYALNEFQYQALDIITGKLCPELGGHNNLIDIIGCNYYYNSQWEYGGQLAVWPAIDVRRIPLSSLLKDIYHRCNKPLLITETGHFGAGRAQWLREISFECTQAINDGLDIKGICLYPIIDRPDWDNLHWYHNSGLWDINVKTKERIVNAEYFKAIEQIVNEECKKSRQIIETELAA